MATTASVFAAEPCLHKDPGEAAVTIPLKSAVGEAAFAEAMASGKYRYVGSAKCRLCHREFFLGRKKDPHDFAMDLLTEVGAEENPKCLVCHTTGFGVATGFVSLEKTPRLANVQCEGCHGPGNVHIQLGQKKKPGGFLAGIDHPERLRKMCNNCHTQKWKGDPQRLDQDYKSYRSPEPGK